MSFLKKNKSNANSYYMETMSNLEIWAKMADEDELEAALKKSSGEMKIMLGKIYKQRFRQEK